MEYKKITSTSNDIIKRASKISSSNSFAKKENSLFLDGYHLVGEYLKKFSQDSVETIFVDEFNGDDETLKLLEKIDHEKIILVTPEVMKKISGSNTPQGIALISSRLENSSLSNYKSILVLENVSDPGNVGTILRTAAATGFEAVYLSKGCADIWSQKVLRSGQGAHFYIDTFQNFDLSKVKNNFNGKLFGTILDEKAKNLYETNLEGDIGFVMGNEGAGLSEEGKEICDEFIYIPMQSGFESLNVAVCAAMCMGEKLRVG